MMTHVINSPTFSNTPVRSHIKCSMFVCGEYLCFPRCGTAISQRSILRSRKEMYDLPPEPFLKGSFNFADLERFMPSEVDL